MEVEIVPPAELQKEYYVLLKEKLGEKKDEQELAHQDAIGAANDLHIWCNTDYRPAKK